MKVIIDEIELAALLSASLKRFEVKAKKRDMVARDVIQRVALARGDDVPDRFLTVSQLAGECAPTMTVSELQALSSH